MHSPFAHQLKKTYNNNISVFETVDDFCPLLSSTFLYGVHTVGILDGIKQPSINHYQVHKPEQEGNFAVVVHREENVAGQHEVPCLNSKGVGWLRVPSPYEIAVRTVPVHNASCSP